MLPVKKTCIKNKKMTDSSTKGILNHEGAKGTKFFLTGFTG